MHNVIKSDNVYIVKYGLNDVQTFYWRSLGTADARLAWIIAINCVMCFRVYVCVLMLKMLVVCCSPEAKVGS